MLVYLQPQSSFPHLHSDTIFGSVIYAISQLYGEELESIVAKFKDENLDPPFLVSSAFPYIQGTEKIRLFPKIIDEPVKADPEKVKAFKKVEFIEESIFVKWSSGTLDEKKIIDNLNDYYLHENMLFMDKPDVDFNRGQTLVPKNSINRLSNASENIFYAPGDNYKNMGLFFLIKIINEKYSEHVKAAIRFLSDRGFGRDISTGGGHFKFEIEDIELDKAEGQRFVILSRYIPQNEELKHLSQNSWFEIGSKRGRSSSGEIRKQIRFFSEGSTFKSLNKKFHGKIVESGHNSLEYGLAYTFNMK
ncbi:MAG: type III-A CRISPR-associated RAMP protein Csm4 [Methanobacterium sp.]|jgi:CRISPR-associated protein Csm4